MSDKMLGKIRETKCRKDLNVSLHIPKSLLFLSSERNILNFDKDNTKCFQRDCLRDCVMCPLLLLY